MSIFVIDDHPLMREAVVMLLRRLRASTQVVELERLASVSKAIAEHGEPELVCLDLKLPDCARNPADAARHLADRALGVARL